MLLPEGITHTVLGRWRFLLPPFKSKYAKGLGHISISLSAHWECKKAVFLCGVLVLSQVFKLAEVEIV